MSFRLRIYMMVACDVVSSIGKHINLYIIFDYILRCSLCWCTYYNLKPVVKIGFENVIFLSKKTNKKKNPFLFGDLIHLMEMLRFVVYCSPDKRLKNLKAVFEQSISKPSHHQPFNVQNIFRIFYCIYKKKIT